MVSKRVKTYKTKNISKVLLKRKKTAKQFCAVLLILFVLYVFGFGDYGFYRYYQLQKVEVELATQLLQLEQEAKKLQTEMDLLKKEDPEYIQRVAREKYGLVKQDEKVYIVKPSSQDRDH